MSCAERRAPRILIERDTWFFIEVARWGKNIHRTWNFRLSRNLFRLNFNRAAERVDGSFHRNTLYYQPVRWKFRRKTNKHRKHRGGNISCDSSSRCCATWLPSMLWFVYTEGILSSTISKRFFLKKILSRSFFDISTPTEILRTLSGIDLSDRNARSF